MMQWGYRFSSRVLGKLCTYITPPAFMILPIPAIPLRRVRRPIKVVITAIADGEGSVFCEEFVRGLFAVNFEQMLADRKEDLDG